MPIRRNRSDRPPQQPEQQVSALRQWLAGGVRVGSGLIGSSGLWPGAIAAGAGELLAEGIEGSLDWDTTPARVSTEAAIGAVPFSKVAKLGKAGASMVRGGIFSGAGDVGRQWAEGNFEDENPSDNTPAPGWNYGRTAIATGLGTATGGLLGHFLHAPKAPDEIPAPPVQLPRRTITTPRRTTDPKIRAKEDELSLQWDEADRGFDARRIADAQKAEQGALTRMADEQRVRDVALGGQHVEELDELAKRAKETAKRELIQRERAARGVVKQPTTFSSTVSSTTPTGVKESMTTKFAPPKADGEDPTEGVNELLDMLTAGGTRGNTADVVQTVQNATRGVPARTVELLKNLDEKALQYFNHLVNVEGESASGAYKAAYREMAQRMARVSRPLAQNAPEAPKNPVAELQQTLTPAARTAPDPDQLRATTHPSFYDEGFEGLEDANDILTRRQSMSPSFFDDSVDNLPIAPGKSTIPPAAAEKLAKQSAGADPAIAKQLQEASAIYNDPNATKEAKRTAGKQLGQLRDMLEGKGKYKPKNPLDPSSEKGIGQTEALLSAALGLGGGLTGAAVDASSGDDSPWDGAAFGALAGAGIGLAPALANSLGRDAADLADPNKVKQMAIDIAAKIPQIQRASLLTSTNLPANAWLGPQGSVVVHLIEEILKGNYKQALPALKEAINPATFVKSMWDNRDEAYDRLVQGELGRDAIDTRLIGQSGKFSNIDAATILPGWVMTSGDIAAFKLLKKYGYDDDTIKRAILTSEPTSAAGRDVANFGKGSWLFNLLFPFKRTPANIMEQGAQRLPFIGPMISRKMGRELSNHDALVEQGLSTAFGVGSGAVAANIEDDQTRRALRAFITNPTGKYSLASNLGWITGDAIAAGQGPESVLTDPFTYEAIVPLPRHDIMMQAGTSAKNIIKGEVDQVTDVIPRNLTFERLRKIFQPGFEAAGLPSIYTDPNAATGRRGIRRNRTPRS